MDVPEQLAEETHELAERARDFTVTTAAEYGRVGEHLTAAKALQHRIREWFAPLKEAAFVAHRKLCEAEKRELAPLLEAETAFKRAIVQHEREQERIRRQRAAELAAQARKIEEEERLREAVELEAAGETALAERILEAPIETPAIVVERPRAPTGIAMRTTWRTEVTDKMALIRAVAEGKAEVGLISVNQSALDGMARSLKGALSIPGVRVVSEKTVAAGRAIATTALTEDEIPY